MSDRQRGSNALIRTVLRLVHVGLSATLQDRGRVGWRKFGVPLSGAMDDHAASWANRLLDNSIDAPVLELLLQGAHLEVLEDTWIAVTGADAASHVPLWRAIHVAAGEELHFDRSRLGVWTYVAVEDGFVAEHRLGSCSVYARGGLGQALSDGAVLDRAGGPAFELPQGVAGRHAAWSEIRDYSKPPPLRVWRGPQWDAFADSERQRFFDQAWQVSPQCDRVGYRLTGKALSGSLKQIISEPVRVGAIQIPDNGQPIITMRDGPTIGGYPKLGVVDPADLSWLVQCRPGQSIRFELTHGA